MTERFAYARRPTREVRIGDCLIGADHPILVQSMCTSPTQDVQATVAQAIRLAEVGCELVRITAPGVKDARALREIRREFSAAGFAHIPLCADIHFMPAAAMEAVEHVEKVRINPGNYSDKKRFEQREYSDAEWAEELARLHERFLPLVRRAKECGRALRIGCNHGSLSDRIMNRYGDSPEGMCASALEFCDICDDEGFRDIVISMKASNPKVMVQAYRMLVDQLDSAGRDYPLHLGVTEAGDGEDGRCKSAAGIGSLLADGIGDTIRVSLTEEPEAEIPVARRLVELCCAARQIPTLARSPLEACDPLHFARRPSEVVQLAGCTGPLAIGGSNIIRVISDRPDDKQPPVEWLAQRESLQLITLDGPAEERRPVGLVLIDLPVTAPDERLRAVLARPRPQSLVGIGNCGSLTAVQAYRLLAACIAERGGPQEAICLHLPDSSDPLQLACWAGSLLIDGIGDALYLPHASDPRDEAYRILQSVRARMTRTDFVACPSCGRTLFDLQQVTAKIKAATGHLDGVSIAIMGCIVNGPGEMADADFGYVGSGPGKITLYRGREAVHRNIPSGEAVSRLIELIKTSGKWRAPGAA